MDNRNDTTFTINDLDADGSIVESTLDLDNTRFFLSECFLGRSEVKYFPHRSVDLDRMIEYL